MLLDARTSLASRFVLSVATWTGMLFVGSFARAQVQSTGQPQMACAIADDLAGRSYDRVLDATNRGDSRLAVDRAWAFWEIAAYGRNCRSVRKLANTLTENGFGKESTVSYSKGSSGGGTTAYGAGVVTTVAPSSGAIEKQGGYLANGETPSKSGTSGSSGGAFGTNGTDGSTVSPLPASSPNATVAAIEVVPVGSTSSGGGAAGAVSGGSTGTSSTTQGPEHQHRQYRVTLRMDDGSTEVVLQGRTPEFRAGDRVWVVGGVIER